MDILKFRVRGQALTLTNPNVNLIPVTDTVNQYLCQFEFSEDWDDLNKVVVFKNVSYNITKEVYLSTSNECYIPWEVLSNSGEIFLEVIGTEVRGEVVTVRIPSTLLGFKWQIQEGLLDVSANISPTPDLFEQFVSSVRSDSIVAATARDEAVIARDVAVQSAADASASELAATSAAESAVNSASTASSAASSASESALSVAGVADETKSYAEIASAKAAEASTQAEIAAGAKEDAVTAKAGAEAARDEAATSADLAQTTESHIKTMTVSAHSLAETEAPTVTKTDTPTGFALDFGIPKGATGPKGEDGDNIHYTWVKYADTPTSGISDNPTGKAYMGIAYNKSTPVGSTVYSDYAWSRIKGEAGEDGYSPTVTTGTSSDGSTELTVTNKEGSTTTTLVDGKARADIANLEIGGRNLFLNTGEVISNANYRIAEYIPANEPLKEGEIYTATICITPAENVSEIRVYFGQGFYAPCRLQITETSKQIISKTFTMAYSERPPEAHPSYAYAQLYRFPEDGTVTGNTTIHWFKIEKGNKATDWTPAPEEVQGDIDSIQNNLNNLEIGGRNLLHKSETRSLSKYMTEFTTEKDIEVPEWGANNAFRSYGVCSSSTIIGVLSTGALFPESKLGQAYVHSIYVKNNGEIAIIVSNNDIGVSRTIQPGESTRVILYGTGNGIQNLQFVFMCSNVGDAFDITYWHPKIEKGNKATDWTPAPEDKANAPVLLWENARPQDEFGAQAVLNNPSGLLSEYDAIEVEFYNENVTVRVTKGKPSIELSPLFMIPNQHSRWADSRYIDFDDNEVLFENCWGGNTYETGQRTLQNAYLIPYKIYGIKEV